MVMLLTILLVLSQSAVAQASDGNDFNQAGTIPAMVSAVLAAVAVVLTAFVIIRESQDRVRSQAGAVYAWLAKEKDGTGATITVTNASELPIWNVTVRPRTVAGDHTGPAAEKGNSALMPTHNDTWSWKLTKDVMNKLEPMPVLEFTDAAGRHWTRVGAKLTSH